MSAFGSYQLGRKFPWLRRHAAKGFARRILECQRCGTQEEQTLVKCVAECARHEQRFTRQHSKCPDPGVERT